MPSYRAGVGTGPPEVIPCPPATPTAQPVAPSRTRMANPSPLLRLFAVPAVVRACAHSSVKDYTPLQEGVEDTKGNNGDLGDLRVTNLRLVWVSRKSKRTNICIGHNCITSVTVKAASSRLQGVWEYRGGGARRETCQTMRQSARSWSVQCRNATLVGIDRVPGQTGWAPELLRYLPGLRYPYGIPPQPALCTCCPRARRSRMQSQTLLEPTPRSHAFTAAHASTFPQARPSRCTS